MAVSICDPEGPAKHDPIAPEINQPTYHPTDLKKITIDPVALERHCPLDSGRSKTNPSEEFTCSTLGLIDTLPPELYSAVFSQLDLETLTDFRSVNRRAALIVDSIPQYGVIVAHFLNPLRAILSTGLGPYLTLRDLHNALCSHACVHCGEFGPCLYLFTCRRVCFRCLASEDRFLPLTRMSAKAAFGLENRIIPTLPTLWSLPGAYSYNEKSSRKRVNLVDREAARQAGISIRGSSAVMEQYVLRTQAKKVPKYEDSIRKRRKARPPMRPPYSTHDDCRANDPYRFMGAIRAPSLNRRSKAVVLGMACNGCRRAQWITNPLRMYTDDEYLDHLAECKASQRTWAALVSAGASSTIN